MNSSLFGVSGIRALIGQRNDAHYGFNSGIFDVSGGKWTIVYRRATNHNVVAGSQICAADTYDMGATLQNERVIFSDASWDTRNFVAAKMADGRLGIVATRVKKVGTVSSYGAAIFIFSDDLGETWQSSSIAMPAANYGHNFHGSVIDYPSSVGGADTAGFIAYSYGSASGNVDALTTVDNGQTWVWRQNVAVKASPVQRHLETACIRVGTQDKWVMIIRSSQSTGEKNAFAYVSSDPLNFPTQVDTGVFLGGNPPQLTYDPRTGTAWFFAFGRYMQPIETFERHMLAIPVDADALFNASGKLSSLGQDYKVLAAIPDGPTGYIHPFLLDGKWYATFICGEDCVSHAYSKLMLIGDFQATAAEVSYLSSELSKRNAPALPDFGTYTPVLSAGQNVQASGPCLCHFTRVGNQVSVWGVITVDPAALGEIKLAVSLPIGSTFTAPTDCRGVATTANAGQRAGVIGTSIDQQSALLVVNAEITSNTTWTTMFSYELK